MRPKEVTSQLKKQKINIKYRKGIFCAVAILLVLLIVSLTRDSRYRMTMYDDHILMEHEILRVIPVGSHVSDARVIMQFNDFTCSTQTSTVLECEQDNGSWFTLVDNNWYVEMSLKKGAVTGAKVWVEPAD